jgi:putative heme iron utilization protein
MVEDRPGDEKPRQDGPGVDRPRNVVRETDAEAIRLAKTLLRSARHGALAVLEPATGTPLASRVATATDMDGSPLILISGLSAHTSALTSDPRCSLLVGEPGKGDPLAHPRITIVCTATRLERGTPDAQRARRRFLNRHPKAKLYVDLGDFAFFRLAMERASLNGGFGKAFLLDRADLVTDSPASEALAEAEQGAVDHMNADHRDAIALYARHFAGAADGDWIMTGIDAEGIDIASGDRSRRIFFPAPLATTTEMRKTLVAMAQEARAAS